MAMATAMCLIQICLFDCLKLALAIKEKDNENISLNNLSISKEMTSKEDEMIFINKVIMEF